MQRSGSTSRPPARDGSEPDAAAARVGPVLARGPTADAIRRAIADVCAEVSVIDRGAYQRVLVPGRCHLRRADVERHLQRSFRLPADLEEVMPSWKGRLYIGEDEVVWSSGCVEGPP